MGTVNRYSGCDLGNEGISGTSSYIDAHPDGAKQLYYTQAHDHRVPAAEEAIDLSKVALGLQLKFESFTLKSNNSKARRPGEPGPSRAS